MTFLTRMSGRVLPVALFVAGCASNMGMPQTRDEFVSVHRSGGMSRNAQHVTVSRPFKSVVDDVTEYARQCLNLRESHWPDYRLMEAGGSMTYHPRIESIPGGIALSLQELYNDRVQNGAPPGGIFTLVAEMRAVGSSRTKLDLYYASRGDVVEFLKQWADGDVRTCPSLERGR